MSKNLEIVRKMKWDDKLDKKEYIDFIEKRIDIIKFSKGLRIAVLHSAFLLMFLLFYARDFLPFDIMKVAILGIGLVYIFTYFGVRAYSRKRKQNLKEKYSDVIRELKMIEIIEEEEGDDGI